MWRRPRPCESHAHEYYEPDRSHESDSSDEPDRSYEFDRFYEPDSSDERCAAYEPREPNESREPGGSGQCTVTTS